MSGPRKHTIESVRKFFEDNGCKLLSDTYVNPVTKLDYIATCGHKHSISLSNFQKNKGRKCPKCIGKNWTIDDIKDFFAKNGCKVLDDDYVVGRKIHYIATCGHEHWISLTDFKHGNCRICPNCNRNKPYDLEEVRKYFEDNGCKLLSTEYHGVFKKLKYIAQCGHENEISFDNFKNGKKGRICAKCRGWGLTIDDVRQMFAKEGMTLLSTYYKTHHTPLKYIAQCGHENTMNLMLFRLGVGRKCKNCAGKKDFEVIKKYFEDNGCHILPGQTYGGCRHRLKYVAQCGHENEIDWGQFLRGGGRLCKRCTFGMWNYDEVKKYFKDKGCELLSTEYHTADEKLHYIARCGHENFVDFQHFKDQNCGIVCPMCVDNHESERIAYKIVKELYPDVVKQHHIKTKAGKGCQSFDFYIPSKNMAIEYNGPQHYQFSTLFHRTEEGFKQQLERDERKRKYCETNNILLIELDGRRFRKINMTVDLVKKEIERQLLEHERRHET